MAKGQRFRIEVGVASPETMMMAEPEGYVGFNGAIVQVKRAVTFDTAHPEEIGQMVLECLARNGGTMGGKILSTDSARRLAPSARL